jgi:hypothetical protein
MYFFNNPRTNTYVTAYWHFSEFITIEQTIYVYHIGKKYMNIDEEKSLVIPYFDGKKANAIFKKM